MSVHDTQNEQTRESAIDAATRAIREDRLVVLPTDTVYGIGADAFSASAVAALLEAKGRGRDVPPPVLVGDPAVLMALAAEVPDVAERLADEFWPGPLTLILTAQPSLSWDLGETRGTVALRMPDDDIALELLRRTGPLAVSSANRHGKSAALSVLDAATQLGDAVEVYLDGGPARIGTASTIIDMTVDPPEIVREGALSRERIIEVLGDIFSAAEPDSSDDADADHEDTATGGDGETTAESADSTSTENTSGESSRADGSAADETAAQADERRGDTAPSALELPTEPELEDLTGEAPVLGEPAPMTSSPAQSTENDAERGTGPV